MHDISIIKDGHLSSRGAKRIGKGLKEVKPNDKSTA